MAAELRKSFHESLDQIQTDIAKMMAFLVDAIPRATDAFLDGDLEASEQVRQNDATLDSWSNELEVACSNLLALQQPMAKDLRTILSVISMRAEVERSGDLVCNIAKSTKRLMGESFDPEVKGLLSKMSDEARRLMRYALDAFVESDSTLGLSLADLDDRLDQLNREFFRAILSSSRHDSMDFELAMNLVMVARYLERIGDHAVNIGERIRYMVQGSSQEEIDAEREQAAGLVEELIGDLGDDGGAGSS